jgi:polyhydroxyalkanoate synthesis regulator phasin
MATPKKQSPVPQTQELQESAQRIFLAGLGALSQAEKEGSKLFKKLVKKGEGYAGPGVEQVQTLREELDTRLDTLKKRASDVQHGADERASKAMNALDEQVSRARQGIDALVDGLEARVEQGVTAALHRIGVPTRDEFAELQKSLRQLSKNLDAAKRERQVVRDSVPDVEARASAGGWYEIRVHGLLVDRVQGEDAATRRVAELRAQDFSTGPQEAREITTEATGGGWYEVKVDGVVVDKVQGRRAADAAIMRLQQQS